jgi:hypothetical protein
MFQRFFRSLCIASKVDKAIALTNEALGSGKCVVIGLQSTGEARAQGAAKAAGLNINEGGDFEAFVSAPNEDLKRIVMQLFPLPPKPQGVIAPEFLNPLKKDDVDDSSDESSRDRNASSRPPLRRARTNVNYSERDVDDEGNVTGKRNRADARYARCSTKKRRSSSTSTIDLVSEDDAYDSASSFSSTDLGLSDGNDDSTSDEESVANEEHNQFSAQKKSRRILWNEIELNKNERSMTLAQRVDYRRLVNYRKACEMVKQWLDIVDQLELPANPLDRLLNERGGPDKGCCIPQCLINSLSICLFSQAPFFAFCKLLSSLVERLAKSSVMMCTMTR